MCVTLYYIILYDTDLFCSALLNIVLFCSVLVHLATLRVGFHPARSATIVTHILGTLSA